MNWRRVLIAGALVLVCLFLSACAGVHAPLESLVFLAFGWAFYFVRVIPKVQPNLAAIVSAAACLLALGFGGHAFLRWLHKHISTVDGATCSASKPWPARLTLALLALVVLMFVAGISAVGVAHQAAWLTNSHIFLQDGHDTIRVAAARALSQNNLKKIVLAMKKYSEDDSEQRLPPAAYTNRTGHPLLSWRVAILPYLGEEGLFSEFHLDEPWDSPHNIRLLPRMPTVYASPAYTDHEPDRMRTHYRVFTGEGTAFESLKGLRPKEDFPDGLATTILVVEAKDEVPWTKPDELPYDPDGPLPALGFISANQFCAGMGDGSVDRFDPMTDESNIRAAITRNGGEPAKKE